MELSDEIKDKIVEIVNSKKMRSIGTALELELESEINSILPPDYHYTFSFNMSGGTENIITYKGQTYYRF